MMKLDKFKVSITKEVNALGQSVFVADVGFNLPKFEGVNFRLSYTLKPNDKHDTNEVTIKKRK